MGSEKIEGIWNKITVYCMNHDKPVRMLIAKNTELIKTPFYACEQYFPENQDEEHLPCPNRLNLDDYQGLVFKFLDIISKEEPTTNFLNYSFTYKGTRQKISVKVLRYDDKEIRLGILNMTVLGL